MPYENFNTEAPVAPATPSPGSLYQSQPTAPPGHHPMSREANRLEIMRQAGVTDKLVPLVKKAVARLEEELDAKTTKFFAHEGEVVEERSVIDHTARQGAIDKTFVLADVLRPRSDQNNGPGNVTVNLIWPGWSSPPPAIDVKAEVVEPASE